MAAAGQVAGVQLQEVAGGRHPDQHHGAAGPDEAQGLRDRLAAADGDEGEVDTATVGERMDPCLDIDVGGVERGGGTEVGRDGKLPRRGVDRDHGLGTRQRRALQGVDADAAGAEHRAAAAGGHGGGVDHRPPAGEHATAEQGGRLERHVVRDHGHLRLVDHDLLGEGAGLQALANYAAIGAVQPVLVVQREPAGAEIRGVVGAVVALAAAAHQGGDHPVARLDAGDPGADLLDQAGGLVAEHRRQLSAPGPVDVVDVAVADAAGADVDADLAGLRRVDLDVLDAQRRTELVADSGPHRLLLHGRFERPDGRGGATPLACAEAGSACPRPRDQPPARRAVTVAKAGPVDNSRSPPGWGREPRKIRRERIFTPAPQGRGAGMRRVMDANEREYRRVRGPVASELRWNFVAGSRMEKGEPRMDTNKHE